MKNSLWTALTTTLAMTMTDGHAYRSLSDLFKGMKAFKFAADVVNRKWKRPLTVTTSDIYSSNFSYDQIDECSYRSFSELFKASLGYEPFKPAADVVNRKWKRRPIATIPVMTRLMSPLVAFFFSSELFKAFEACCRCREQKMKKNGWL